MAAENPFAEGAAYVDGAYVPLAEARIPLIDRGFTRSDATYDVFHVWGGRAFRLEDHLDRFERNMAAMRFNPPLDRAAMRETLIECVRLSGLRDAFVQMTLTRGLPVRGSRDPRLCENRYYAFAMPFVWIANEAQRAAGMHLHVSRVERISPRAVDPRVKNFHWMDLTLGLLEAFDAGADIDVLLDGAGNLTEGPGFNVFVVKDGRLATPAEGMFDGMTRRTVLELARELGIPVEERLVPADEARAADEVFITSTAGGIMPITLIDGAPVGGGQPGPMTRRVHDTYWSRKAEGWLGTPIDYRD